MVQKRYGKKGKALKLEELDTDDIDDDDESCDDTHEYEKYCVAYCEGWCVILNCASGYECFLWNPDTRKKIQLPRMEYRWSSFFKCILSSSPTTEGGQGQSSSVLFFSKDDPWIIFCKVRDRRWIKSVYSKLKEGIYYDAISFKGKIYAIDLDGSIDKIIIDKKKLEFKHSVFELPFIPPMMPSSPSMKLQFVESCDELFIVTMLFKARLVDVFQLVFPLKSLVKINSLGDRVFFCSDGYSGSISGEQIIGMRGNRIYFTEDNHESLYIHDFEEATLSVTPNRSDSDSTLWFSHDGLMPLLRINNKPRNKEQGVEQGVDVEESIRGVDVEESIWGKIPKHLQQSIVRCLPKGRDYMNFRAVCQSWRSLAPPLRYFHFRAICSSWRSLILAPPLHYVSTDCSTTSEYPWLMTIQNHGICNFHDPMGNATYSMCNPKLSNCVIRYAKDGWLLLSQGPRSIFLYEPFTKTKIKLPDLPMDYCFNGICFSTLSNTSTFTVTGIYHVSPEWICICYLRRLGSAGWARVEVDNRVPFTPSWNSPIFLNGSYYCLGQDGSLGRFELGEGYAWNILRNPKPLNYLQTMFKNFLMSYEGELFSVYVGSVAGELIKVFKLDLQGGDWVEVTCLESGILFVSETTSLVVKAREESMKNKIYFPSLSNINNHHVFYSLKTQKYHTFGGGDVSSHRFYDTREYLHSTWIQPRLASGSL